MTALPLEVWRSGRRYAIRKRMSRRGERLIQWRESDWRSSNAISDHAGTNRDGICGAGARLGSRHDGENIEAAKQAASEAIRINLEAYREAGQQVPEGQSVSNHLENPEFRDLLFAYVEVAEPQERIAA